MTEPTSDGLTGVFATRRDAELAVERLVQEHGVPRAEVFVEPVGDAATAGTEIGGGDHRSGDPGSDERSDAPLEGAIRVTVAVTDENRAAVRAALRETNARDIEAA